MYKTSSYEDVSVIMYRMWWDTKIVTGTQNNALWPTNMARIYQNEVFSWLLNSRVLRISGHWNHRQKRTKTVCHRTQNGQKCLHPQLLTISKLPWTGGDGAFNSTRDPKTVCYSPWKWPKNCPKGLVLVTSKCPWTRGDASLKSSVNPKTMDYSP